MRHLLARLAAVTAVGACAPQPPIPPPPDHSGLPVMAPSGLISSAEMVRLFVATCVRNFPDEEAMVQALAERSLLPDGSGEEAVLDPRPRGGVGWFVILEKAAAGEEAEAVPPGNAASFPGDGLTCGLRARLSDPEEFQAALEAMVDAGGRPLDWQGWGAEFERNGVPIRLDAVVPLLTPVRREPGRRTTQNILAEQCGELEACRIWSGAQLDIRASAESVAALRALPAAQP